MFGRLHKTRKTPVNALCLQALLTMVFILVGGGFRTLVNFYSVASWGFYFLTVSQSRYFFVHITDQAILTSGFGSGGFTVQGT